jgi:hypothetical protein
MSDSGAGDVLRRVAGRLDAAGIPHIVVGSFASSYHGVPRSTHDLDIVIDPTLESLGVFIASLPPNAYYADLDMALDALRRRSQFNVIDLGTGWKVDLIVRKNRPFSVANVDIAPTIAHLLGLDPSFVAGTADVDSTRNWYTMELRLSTVTVDGKDFRYIDSATGTRN